MTVIELGKKAKAASYLLAVTGTDAKNKALLATAEALDKSRGEILAANALDMAAAAQNGMNPIMQDRLKLSDTRIDGMIAGLKDVCDLKDPIGSFISMETRPNGLTIGRQRVPLGVIGIIYESRPNVTVDAAALCLKSGNAVILRGGTDAFHSNKALVDIMRGALGAFGLTDAVQLLEDTRRETAVELMRLTKYVDVLIPRGGAGLIASVMENASVPVIETGVGNCHIYIDSSADLNMGVEIVFNAKCSRPSVCNSAENLLVARDIAKEFLPMVRARLDEMDVELRGCGETLAILGDGAVKAGDNDYYTEFLAYIMAVKVVADVDEAIAFINEHSTHHSEAIVTKDYAAARKFQGMVDSAAVYVNASTRYTDGSEFGLGAEIGISTQKLHARGPMGLSELTSSKYIISGDGQVRV